MVGLAAIPGGVLFGGAWHYFGATTAFTFAAGIAAMSVYLLQFWVQLPAGFYKRPRRSRRVKPSS
jgi:hypothetical protein